MSEERRTVSEHTPFIDFENLPAPNEGFLVTHFITVMPPDSCSNSPCQLPTACRCVRRAVGADRGRRAQCSRVYAFRWGVAPECRLG